MALSYDPSWLSLFDGSSMCCLSCVFKVSRDCCPLRGYAGRVTRVDAIEIAASGLCRVRRRHCLSLACAVCGGVLDIISIDSMSMAVADNNFSVSTDIASMITEVSERFCTRCRDHLALPSEY